MSSLLNPVTIAIIAIVILILFVLSCYKKAASSEVLIITGAFIKEHDILIGKNGSEEPLSTKVRVVKGGGAFVIPFLQQYSRESLATFPVTVKVQNVLTENNVPVDAEATASLRVGSTADELSIAAERVFGADQDELLYQLSEIVEAGTRESLSSLPADKIKDRQAFADAVERNVVGTFARMGIEILTLQITEFSDKQGYFKSLGAKEIADKNAAAKKAEAEANNASRQAVAQQDKEARLVEFQNEQEAREAELNKEKAIAERAAEVEQRKAELKAQVETKNEIARQAPLIEQQRQEALVQREAKIARDAELQATVIAEQEAEAQKAQIKAEAQAAVRKTEANAEAEAVKTVATAQATAIEQKGIAQAKAQEELSKALEKNGQAALAMAIIEQLPAITQSFAQAYANIDSLTVFDGAEGVGQGVNTGLAQSLSMIKETTGIDVAELVGQKAQLSQATPVVLKEEK